MRQQGQGEVSIPPSPAPDLVVVQPHLALGFPDRLFDVPATTRRPHDLR